LTPQRERERERESGGKNGLRVAAKKKSRGEVRDTIFQR
jgi:hypothetical protein